MKRLLSIFMASLMCVFLFGGNTYASAANLEVTGSIDEISYIKYLKSLTEDELRDKGYTEEEISDILALDLDQVLIEYSKMSQSELKRQGFEERQIKAIKNYNESIDAIEYMEINALSSATLSYSLSPQKSSCSNSRFKFTFTTIWSERPFFIGTDIVALNWSASNAGSIAINTSYYTTPVATAYYYNMEYDTYVKSTDLSITKYINYLSAKIPLRDGSNNDGTPYAAYAKKVVTTVDLKPSASGNSLYAIQIMAGYGHSTITISPDVSFSPSPSIGISFSSTMQDLCNDYYSFDYKGNTN